MTTTNEYPRYVRLRRWMAYHGITDRDLGEKLGDISAQAVNKMLKNDTMPVIHHEKCIRLGFPQDILPQPYNMPRGRVRPTPVFPGLQQAEQEA